MTATPGGTATSSPSVATTMCAAFQAAAEHTPDVIRPDAVGLPPGVKTHCPEQ